MYTLQSKCAGIHLIILSSKSESLLPVGCRLNTDGEEAQYIVGITTYYVIVLDIRAKRFAPVYPHHSYYLKVLFIPH